MTKQLRSELLLLMITVVWGASYILTKIGLNTIEPFNLKALRFIIAFCVSAVVFLKIKEFPNTYFDFYSSEAFTRQINYITDFYQNFIENLDRSFVYLTKEEMDTYIENTTNLISDLLHNKLLKVER